MTVFSVEADSRVEVAHKLLARAKELTVKAKVAVMAVSIFLLVFLNSLNVKSTTLFFGCPACDDVDLGGAGCPRKGLVREARNSYSLSR
jgi:hypothetical protein